MGHHNHVSEFEKVESQIMLDVMLKELDANLASLKWIFSGW